MTSFLGKIVASAIRIYTYPYRRKQKSLSSNVKLKLTPYIPPKGTEHTTEVYDGTKVEKLSANFSNDRIIVHFHGGGAAMGMNDLYRKTAERLLWAGKCDVYTIDYQVGKDKIHPSLLDECTAAFFALTKKFYDKKIIAVGDSMGANFLLASCFRARDNGVRLPDGIILVSPFLDMSASGESYSVNCRKDPMYGIPFYQSKKKRCPKLRRIPPYVGNTDVRDPYLSPVFGSFENICEILVQVGEYETSASDSTMLARRAEKYGVETKLEIYRGMFHDFQYFAPFLKESRLSWRSISEFIDKV